MRDDGKIIPGATSIFRGPDGERVPVIEGAEINLPQETEASHPRSMDGAEIYRRMKAAGTFTDSLEVGEQCARDACNMQYNVAERLGSLQRRMAEHWRGDSAEKCKSELSKGADCASQAAELVELTSPSMNDQNAQFWRAYNDVEPLEESEEEARGGAVRSVTGVLPGVNSNEDIAEEWRQKNGNNIAVYGSYEVFSHDNRGQFGRIYPEEIDTRPTSSSDDSSVGRLERAGQPEVVGPGVPGGVGGGGASVPAAASGGGWCAGGAGLGWCWAGWCWVFCRWAGRCWAGRAGC